MVSLDRIKKLKENQQKIQAFESMKRPVAKYVPEYVPPAPVEKKTFGQKFNELFDAGVLGLVDKGARAFDEGVSNLFKGTVVEQAGKDFMAGIGDVNKARIGALQSVGMDKIPGVKQVLADIKQGAQNLSEQGGTGIGSQVVRSLPGAASSMALAMMGGGIKPVDPLAGNTALQTVQNVAKSPVFANSMLQSYGGAYNEAREAGANRPTAITSALAQAIPQSLIEVSGGLEQLPAKVGKQGLLKTIGQSALEEGLEEVLQYPFEGLGKKATYAPETPVFSMDEQAVINPVQMAQHGLVGGIAGGLLGGGAKVVSDIPTLTQKIKAKMQQDTQTIKPSTPSNFEADTDTVSQYIQQAKDAEIPQTVQQEAAPTVKTKQTIEKELVQKHKQAEQLRREYEQLRAASKLTPDELTIADNIRKGKLNPENIPQGMNAQVINDVANAGRLYDQVNNEIKDYNIQRKQTLYETMDSLLEDSDNAKDKAGWKLSRETPERNAIDVFGEKAGKRINETVFRPVHDNEARRTKFINEYVRKAKELNITNKKHKLDAPMLINGKQQHTLTEREAVQLVGEKKITLDDLPQTMDKGKIQNAVTSMRKWYDDFLRWANEVLVRNGYKPVDYRKDYFPHFDDPQDPFVKAMKAMGFKVDNITLPTDIAGITHYFRPGKKWFGHFLRREGAHTTYDALEGFERYLYGISDVIYHTDDIQRLRAFETAIRMKYAPDNIKNRIQEIRNSDLSPDEQQSAIDALFELDRGHLGNYVTDLRNYTDTLAGKKSISDRNMEHKLGRATYNIFDNLNIQVARNMIGWNVSSWLTNFIPIAQAGGGIKSKNLLKAARDTVLSYINDDGFRDKSTFLTNRKGIERLNRTTIQKLADAGLAPMEFIDDIATQILVRGKYYDNIERGMSHQQAIDNADDYTAGAVADRSKGAMPTAFYAKNPLTKLFTLFQLEVNNQYSFLFKDLPREAKELGGKWLAMTLLKAAVGSYIFNELFERLSGRRPAPDLIGTVVKALKKDTPLSAIQSVTEDILEDTPFIGGILGGGRLPIQAALPDLMGLIQGDTSWQKELTKPLIYLVSPIGGGGQAKKMIEGIRAYGQGASITDSGRMRFPIAQTPLNRLRTTLFGQYSTPEAREYFDKDRQPLGEKQTQQVMQSEDPKKEYENFLRQRQINRLKDQLEKATSEKEKAEIRKQIKELRAAQ